MSKSEWSKTPYAGTEAKNADQAVTGLLEKYGVTEYQWTRGTGPCGRAAILLRFNLRGKMYRMMIEVLDVSIDVPRDDLIRQAYRAMFYHLKSTLEMSTIFYPLETLLFAFLELPSGSTMYEMAMPHMSKLQPGNFSQLMLPAPAKPSED